MILLVGPVASWTDSVVVLRGYLTATAALALGLAFWPWTRVLPHPVAAPVAAGLYATLWVVLFYAGAPLPT